MNKAGVALLTASHAVDDLYQGAVPALLPFLIAERHYSYAAASGLTLAATILSSVAQPAFGLLTDRRRMMWLIGLGLTIAGLGIGFSGLSDNYLLTWLAIAFSGLGVAAFHPEAARVARQVSGGQQIGMSWFSLGGNIGFSLGPLFVTGVLLITGVSGTIFLIVPALLMGATLLILYSRLGEWATTASVTAKRRANRPQTDNWREFGKLTSMVICRSIVFFGISSFIALYVTHVQGQSAEIGEAALITFLVSGAIGTMLGGWLSDRWGRLTTIRVGYAMVAPLIVGLLLAGQPWIFGFVALLGIAASVPNSLQVTLGQDYLPTRIGTASGVTLGLAVSAGGLFAPVLGFIADNSSLSVALAVLIIAPLAALAVAFWLREPHLPAASPTPSTATPLTNETQTVA